MRVGIVGCGQIAEGHVSELNKLGSVRVAAVCDRHTVMAKQLGDRFDVPKWYSDFEEMLSEERLDAVHVTTPPISHRDLALRALAAGCHVLVEKPFGIHAGEAEQIIAAARAADRKVTVGYTYYFDPPSLRLREMVASGRLGEVVHVESNFGYDLAGPFGAAIMSNPDHWVHRLPGKLFQNNISHAIHVITEFLDDPSPRVFAAATTLHERRSFGDVRDALEDELRVMIVGGEMTAYLTFSGTVRPGHKSARVCGTRDTVMVDYVTRTVLPDARVRLPTALGRAVPPFRQGARQLREGVGNVFRFARSDFHFFAGFQELFRRFYACINTDGDVPIPYAKILQDAQLMDRIFEAVRSGKG